MTVPLLRFVPIVQLFAPNIKFILLGPAAFVAVPKRQYDHSIYITLLSNRRTRLIGLQFSTFQLKNLSVNRRGVLAAILHKHLTVLYGWKALVIGWILQKICNHRLMHWVLIMIALKWRIVTINHIQRIHRPAIALVFLGRVSAALCSIQSPLLNYCLLIHGSVLIVVVITVQLDHLLHSAIFLPMLRQPDLFTQLKRPTLTRNDKIILLKRYLMVKCRWWQFDTADHILFHLFHVEHCISVIFYMLL